MECSNKHLQVNWVYTVSKLLGHASIKTTERYAHLAEGHVANAVEILSEDYSTVY